MNKRKRNKRIYVGIITVLYALIAGILLVLEWTDVAIWLIVLYFLFLYKVKGV